MKAAIIINPAAGSASDDVKARIRAKAFEVGADIISTGKHGDAEKLAKSAVKKGYTRIFAAGGDGTLSHVVDGIAPHFDKVSVGVLPIGTCNDLARNIGIPLDERMLSALDSTNTQKCSIFKVENKKISYGLMAMGGGILGEVTEETISQPLKKLFGAAAFAPHIVTRIAEQRIYKYKITGDSRRTIFTEGSNVILYAHKYVACGIEFAPFAEKSLNLLVIKLIDASDFARLFGLVSKRVFNDKALSEIIRSEQIYIESIPESGYVLDGESIGTGPVKITLMKDAVNIVIP